MTQRDTEPGVDGRFREMREVHVKRSERIHQKEEKRDGRSLLSFLVYILFNSKTRKRFQVHKSIQSFYKVHKLFNIPSTSRLRIYNSFNER